MIAFYITAHGYGHAARSLKVIEALQEHQPVTVVTRVSPSFFSGRLGPSLSLRPRAFDLGLIQIDSVRGDVAATLRAYQPLMGQTEELIDEEVAFLRDSGVKLVVVDSPALPLSAARRCGIPGLALTSFGWDYIYSPFVQEDPGWSQVCEWFQRHYRAATFGLQYPFAAPIEAIASREEVPLVATPGRVCREAIAARSGADPDKPWVLVWFHQLEPDLGALESLPVEIFTVGSLGWPIANGHQVDMEFVDLLASCDAVVSKPGFGILSDCIANRKPLVYVPRTDFREAQLLEVAIQRHLRYACITPQALYAGDWQPSLEQARMAPEPEQTVAVGGAEQIAARVLSFL